MPGPSRPRSQATALSVNAVRRANPLLLGGLILCDVQQASLARVGTFGVDDAMNDTPAGDEARGRRRRSDAEKNIDRIEQAAAELLLAEPEAGLEEIAAAAGVSRSTIYRHFGSREELVGVVAQRARETSDSNQSDALRPPGELAGGPTPLDVADVLNKVPPHLLGDQIVAEAQRLTGVTSVALYLIDIDGTLLLRLAGSDEFPTELEAPLAVGPEIPREGLPRAASDDRP